MRRLLAATCQGPERFGMSGPERALLYRVTLETALRRNELRSLKVSSFDFARNTVTVRAGYSKRRCEDTLPLRPETAAELQTFLAGKVPGVKAFGGTCKHLTDKTAKMIEADLGGAGISYVGGAGRYRDFHALRHTCGSWLAAAGVHPKVIQEIMRHSDINLTMTRYGHTLRGQEAGAVAKLPSLSLSGPQNQKATGTDGKGIVLAENLAELGAPVCANMCTPAETTSTGAMKNAVLTAPGGTRTPDPRFRKPVLYPAELRAQNPIGE